MTSSKTPMTPERREQLRRNMRNYRKRLAKKREAEADRLAELEALVGVKDVSK